MPPPFDNCKVLVVEDEYLIADDLAALLRDAGAEVVGPAYSLPMARRIAGDTARIDGAVLDVNLRGVSVFPLADVLRARGIPILLLTAYGEFGIPDEYAALARCEKPASAVQVIEVLKSLLSPVAAEQSRSVAKPDGRGACLR